MTELKLGSLFDGIGGFPLAATMNDIRPVWASEIEPFPMAVTAYRFPQIVFCQALFPKKSVRIPCF